MISRIRGLAKEFVPPVLWRRVRRVLGSGRQELFHGEYSSWRDAKMASSGYDAPAILEKARKATHDVLAGKAAYERDTVTFAHPQQDHAKLSGLLLAAAASSGRLSVMDVGGALGSSYFQNRGYLSQLDGLRWSVLEQPHYVQCGQREFQTDVLKFYGDMDELLRLEQPNVALLSGVLQYLPEPYELLKALTQRHMAFILIDRTPMASDGRRRLVVQRVASQIYDASYPCWIFDRTSIESVFGPGYAQLDEFRSQVEGEVQCEWGWVEFRGMLFHVLQR